MSKAKTKQSQIQEIERQREKLNKQVIPQINEIFKQMKEFHSREASDFKDITQKIERVEDELRDKQEECETCINEINSKRKEQEKLGQISVGVLEAKSEEIKSKVKNIDAVSSGIKETVGKIKPEKLMKLPVSSESERMLKKLFQTVYQTLYAEEEERFEWEKFKKLALKHEGGEDFIFRLVNVNFKDLPTPKYESLLQLKADPQFEHTSVNSQYAYDIIDLADWVEYVCLGHQFSLEKKKAEKEYDKIRRDVDKKSKSSLQMSENFWKEASLEIETFQSEIQSINSELKALAFGFKKSIDECDEVEAKKKQRIDELLSIKANA